MKRREKRVFIVLTKYGNSNVDKVREQLAKEFIRRAKEERENVLLCDGGSQTKFLKEVRDSVLEVIECRCSMGAGRRKLTRRALEMGFDQLIYVEPEKHMYPSLIKEIIDKKGESSILVLGRSSIETYPNIMRVVESKINGVWNAITGLNWDVCHGPQIWNKKTAEEYILSYDGRFGDKWDSLFSPLTSAVLGGEMVSYMEIDYPYPKIQKEAEDTSTEMVEKRVLQLEVICNTIIKTYGEHIRKENL